MPLPCASTAFAAKPLPFLADCQGMYAERWAARGLVGFQRCSSLFSLPSSLFPLLSFLLSISLALFSHLASLL